jgi:hypothetical protein
LSLSFKKYTMKFHFLFFKALLCLVIFYTGNIVHAQCSYHSALAGSNSAVTFNLSGGSFQSYGCAPIDPTYWVAGNAGPMTVTFTTPQTNPSFRVWGMNDDDVASVQVNGNSYSLNSGTASLAPKVVCGISPGPDGVAFVGGNLTGANSPGLGNYSYQDVTINAANVSSITVQSLSGAGWGFVGVSTSGLSISTSAINTSCGNSNGSASVSVTLGSGSFTYLWSNGGTTDTINNLSAGNYTVTVSGTGGCSAVASVTVNSSGNTPVTITSDKSVMCSGDSAAICAPAGYTSYVWNTGQTGQCITTKLAGNYYVTVTDAGSCTAASNHLALSVYPSPPVSVTVNGDTLTGYDAVTYQWYHNNVLIPGATSDVYIALQGGNYTLAVTDTNGCRSFSTNLTVVLGMNDLVNEAVVAVYPNPLASGNNRKPVGKQV